MNFSEFKESGSFENPPTGTHVGRAIKIIDIGTQRSEYMGEPTVRRQIIFGWELPNTLMKDGRPFTISRFYTASKNEKATLRIHLEAWRGRAFTDEELKNFDLKNVLDKTCYLSIVEDKGKIKVGGVMQLPKEIKVAARLNDLIYFDTHKWDQRLFDSFSDGIKALIMKSDEYLAMQGVKKPMSDAAFEQMKNDLPWEDEPAF